MRAQTTIPSSLHKSQIRRHLWALARNRRSPRSTKTHQVEPDGALGKSRHLTRGDLWGESLGGVSRGYSSVPSRVIRGSFLTLITTEVLERNRGFHRF